MFLKKGDIWREDTREERDGGVLGAALINIWIRSLYAKIHERR